MTTMNATCAIGNFLDYSRNARDDFCWNIQVHWGLILSGF